MPLECPAALSVGRRPFSRRWSGAGPVAAFGQRAADVIGPRLGVVGISWQIGRDQFAA